jgi:hypothetical protein
MTENLTRLELPSVELAAWLDKQDPDVWWLVDGDPLLTGNVSFPCTGDVLAAELRRLDRTLLLVPPEDANPEDRPLASADLDGLFHRENGDERIFVLRWARSSYPHDWLLIEDLESAGFARELDDFQEN